MLWSAPFKIIVIFFILYSKIGYSSFVGSAALLFMMPLNSFMAKRFNQKLREKLKIKDKRISSISEMLNFIKVQKYVKTKP
jgi:hypothetical protein